MTHITEDLEIEEVIKPEYELNLYQLPKVQEHNWIKRGIKYSCETLTHPNHHVWIRQDITTSPSE